MKTKCLMVLFGLSCILLLAGVGASEGWDFKIDPPNVINDTSGNGDYTIEFSVLNKSTNDTYRGLGTVEVTTVCRNPDGDEKLFSQDERIEIRNGEVRQLRYKFHSNVKLARMGVGVELHSPDGKHLFDVFNAILKVQLP
jgi:hypothetical protein